MKVAINVFPLKSAHENRGIGYYTRNLIEYLKMDESVDVIEFTNLTQVKDADIVHYPWFDLYFHTLPFKKKFPTVVTIHDVVPLKFSRHYPVGLKGKINLALQKISLRSCKHIITDSEVSKKDIATYLKIKDENITAIPLSADKTFQIQSDTKLLHIRRKYNLPDQFLLYVGDANWVKNLPFLIEAFHRVIKDYNQEGLKLALVGGVFLKKVENIDHPELESLKNVNRLITNFNLEDRVIRPGNLERDELVAFYNLATVYTQPSLYEGFGIPVIEAFACGTPVVCSNKGSLPEIGGDAAIYFDPTNSDQFISILMDLLQNKSLQDKLSLLGLKRAERYSWEKTARLTKQVYEKVKT